MLLSFVFSEKFASVAKQAKRGMPKLDIGDAWVFDDTSFNSPTNVGQLNKTRRPN